MKDNLPPRLARELATITAMIAIYCRDHHQPADAQLCPQCRELAAYAAKRLARCPFQKKKPTCGNCTVHCYAPRYRIEVRSVMRYAGPRMVWAHPLMALRHLIDSRRRPPIPGQRHHSSLSTRNKDRTKS